MPFDDAKWDAVTKHGELGGVALTTSIALDAIVEALEALERGESPSEAIKKIKEQATRLDKTFDDLTGWRPE
jgi:hypothetical protein